MVRRRRWALAWGAATTALLLASVAPAAATFTGSAGRIAFSRFVEATDSLEIFSIRPDGTSLVQLTSNPGRSAGEADWSPDGQRIAFDSDRIDDEVHVFVSDWDGSDVTQLTSGPGFHGGPAWSPDGRSMAIEADWGDYPDHYGLWIIPSSGSERGHGRRSGPRHGAQGGCLLRYGTPVLAGRPTPRVHAHQGVRAAHDRPARLQPGWLHPGTVRHRHGRDKDSPSSLRGG